MNITILTAKDLERLLKRRFPAVERIEVTADYSGYLLTFETKGGVIYCVTLPTPSLERASAIVMREAYPHSLLAAA